VGQKHATGEKLSKHLEEHKELSIKELKAAQDKAAAVEKTVQVCVCFCVCVSMYMLPIF
jgi:hypothetical protein